jgi:hypothetical protein
MRRIPLWATLIPLVVAIAGYRIWWTGERDAFRAAIEQALPGRGVTMGGFPYRLEAQVEKPGFRRDGDIFARFAAERLVANRQPWSQDLVVGRLVQPRLQMALPAVAGLRLDIEAASSQTSLRARADRIDRLSSVHDDARIRFMLLPAAATAPSFELHFREIPATRDPASRSPALPDQAQIVLSAAALRFGGGDPLAFAADVGIRSAAPVRDVATWRRGGTLELRRMTLRDAHGEILSMAATASPGTTGRMQVAGTIDTVCPFTVQAAFGGRPALAELRTRRPMRLAFSGMPGDFDLVEPDGGLRAMPVRAQEPPCPVLRR